MQRPGETIGQFLAAELGLQRAIRRAVRAAPPSRRRTSTMRPSLMPMSARKAIGARSVDDGPAGDQHVEHGVPLTGAAAIERTVGP
jgi:hypothetical protein